MRVAAMHRTSKAGLRGEAPQAMPAEGALSIGKTSGPRVRGEAPQAMPAEGALSPNNGGDR